MLGTHKPALGNPLPAPSRSRRVATNLSLNRRGAPGSECQASTFAIKMESFLIIFIFFGILAALIAGAAVATSKRGRAIAGVAALGWSCLMFLAAGMVETFNLNIWYSQSAHNLLDASVAGIKAGKGDQVAGELATMRENLEVTYERRGNFKELAEETTVRLKNLSGSSQDEKPPSQ